MKPLLSLPYYHIIYLIITLSRTNFMFIRCEYCSISMGAFINTLQQLHESQTSHLFTKYYNKTDVLLNTTDFGVCFYPQPFKDFSSLILQLKL
jgi:hypothetical protein